MRIDVDIDVNEYLMNFCYEYCVRGFYLEGEGMCYERCKIVK